MANAANGLQVVVNGTNAAFTWNPASDPGADAQWLDIATESGFVNYVAQIGPNSPPAPSPNMLTPASHSFNWTLQNGTYYARINTHFPGFGVFPNDRGWFPSQHVLIVVGDGGVIPNGSPATNLQWVGGVMSWNPGSGSAAITRQALDLSTFPNFDDILASPFVPPVGGTGLVVGLPYAFDVPVSFHQLAIQGLPTGQSFYARLNTLFGDKTWVPGNVLHFNADGSVGNSGGGGFPWMIVGAAAGIVLLAVLAGKDDQEYEG